MVEQKEIDNSYNLNTNALTLHKLGYPWDMAWKMAEQIRSFVNTKILEEDLDELYKLFYCEKK